MQTPRGRWRGSLLCACAAAAVGAAGPACKPDDGPAGRPCVDCGTPQDARDTLDLTLQVESRYAPVTGAALANVYWNPAGERPPRSLSAACSSDGVRALCTVSGVGPGRFAMEVLAEGFHPLRISFDMTDPFRWELLPLRVDVHPLPDPACIAEFAGEEPFPRGAAGNCHDEEDLPAPAPVGRACPSLASARSEPRTVMLVEQADAICARPVSNHQGAFTAPQHRDAMISAIGIPPAFWAADGTGLVHSRDVHYGVAVALPTTSGFLYVDLGWDADYPDQVLAVSSSGEVSRTAKLDWGRSFPAEATAVAQDDDGSALVVSARYGCASYVSGLRAIRVGAAGEPRGADWPVVSLLNEFDAARNEPIGVGVPATAAVVAATDAAGRILVIWEGRGTCGPATLAGRWFDPGGRPLSPVFVAAAALDPFAAPWRLQRLADGSLALQMWDGRWLRRFADGIPAGGPPPAWLAERTYWGVRLIGAGTAHAAIFGDVACAPRIEILSADGEPCGTREYPPPAGAPVTGCKPFMYLGGHLSIGPDGTVSRLTDRRWCPAPAYCDECVYEWWTRDLAVE